MEVYSNRQPMATKATFILMLVGFILPACSLELSLDELKQKAEQGDADAQYNLGLMYYNGEGVPQDDTEAVRWWRAAAEQGFANAQSNLGVMYENGEGVPEDDEEAVRWFRAAAEQGLAEAQFNVGLMYANGRGVTQDDEEAYKWYDLLLPRWKAKPEKVLSRTVTR